MVTSGSPSIPALDLANQAAIDAVFHLYDPPLWLVTARAGKDRGGCIATAITRASIVPDLPRILIAIAQQHYTWQLIESSDEFVLHLLAADDLAAVARFGLLSGHTHNKLAGLKLGKTPRGAPRYEQAVAWLGCRVETRQTIGDRSVYLAAITDGGVLRQAPLLTVSRLVQDAQPEQLAEIKRLYVRDQHIDRAAILLWRRDRAR